MPTETTRVSTNLVRHPVAARRILRLALGTGLALLFSQAISWPLSFVTAVLAMFILALPLPAINLKKGIAFSIALLLPMISAMALLPFLQYARWAGVLLVALALYCTFYFTAKGGPAVIGMFMTVGLTRTVTVGSVNPQVQIILIQSLAKGVVFALVFVWLAHFLIPDRPAPATARPAPAPTQPKPDLAEARRSALRSLFVVLPMALLFLFMSGSPPYTVVMIKVASMGQQATVIDSRKMSVSLLKSTLWGGSAAILAMVSGRMSTVARGGTEVGARDRQFSAVSAILTTWYLPIAGRAAVHPMACRPYYLLPTSL